MATQATSRALLKIGCLVLLKEMLQVSYYTILKRICVFGDTNP